MARIIILSAAMLALTAVAAQAEGAEIRLRKECVPIGNLVLLGDVADIFASDEETIETLKAIELLPVPAPGTQHYFRVRQIQDLLYMRGVNLAVHRFSGASRVHIGTGRAVAKAARRPARISPALARQTQDRAREVILDYLRSQTADEKGQYEIKLALSPTQTRSLSQARSDVSVSGGAKPWLDRQQFVLSFQADDRPVRLPIEVYVIKNVNKADAVVVAKHPLRRGAIVRVSDVSLQPSRAVGLSGKVIDTFDSLDKVVGLETTRSVATGQILDTQLIRPRLMVRRGDVVTVYARTAGVVVRTFARAREDGSHGDLIRVQKLTKDRTGLRARVTGEREVDVLAQSTTVETVPARP